MSENNIEIPEEFKKSSWLADQIIKSPLRSIFIMLIFVITIMSTITIFFYNQREKERSEQVNATKEQWKSLSEKQEKEIVEYKQRWIDCMSLQVERLDNMHSVTKGKKKKTK